MSFEGRDGPVANATKHLGTLSTAIIMALIAFRQDLLQPCLMRKFAVWSLVVHLMCILLSGAAVLTVAVQPPEKQSRSGVVTYFYAGALVTFTAGMLLLVIAAGRQ
jgi:hypothetical protein